MNALLLLLAAAAGGVPRALTHGDWNERIHAVHSLDARSAASLPSLRVAALDADWQVRMTAVHVMGRIGAPAVADLDAVLHREPCRHVRLTAAHWLGSIGGPEAEEALRRGLADESGMVRLVGRYWLAKAEGASAGEDPDAAAAAREDLRHCAASPEPGRAPWAETAAPTEAKPVDEPVLTPDPTEKATSASHPASENLPGAPDLPERAGPEHGTARAETLDRARLDELDVLLGRSTAPAESFPAAPPGSARSDPPGAPADYARDGGKSAPRQDPIPGLIAQLGHADPAKRSRAADELGKRGAAAEPAVPALTKALKDPARRVRAAAALALGNVGPAADSAVPALVAALKKGPEEVEWSAAMALGRLGTPRARRAFARYSRESAGRLVNASPGR